MALIKKNCAALAYRPMPDRRLSALQLLSVENYVLECASFQEIVEQFVAAKAANAYE